LTGEILNYWTNFVKYDNPNHLKSVNDKDFWNTYKPAMTGITESNRGEYIVFSEAGFLMETSGKNDGHNCEFWDSERINIEYN